MNLYEHTIIAKQEASQRQLKEIIEKYSKIVEKSDGNIIKTENWGLLNLSYLIKKNKKGNYIHFKIKGPNKIVSELEKNEKIDNNLIRYLTVKVKKFDLETEYFSKQEKDKNAHGRLSFTHGTRQFLSFGTITRKPEIGKIYLFPNYLMHSVYPFYGEGERRSISFNAYINDDVYDVYSQ